MAYTEFSGALRNAKAAKPNGWLAALRTAISRRMVYNRTMRELSALSARELHDLGIGPAMIKRVAHEAAYGN